MNCGKCGLSLSEDGDRNAIACECDVLDDTTRGLAQDYLADLRLQDDGSPLAGSE